jgi:hypothetical protein
MFSNIPINEEIKYNDNYIIEGSNYENTKGVFKIKSSSKIFNGSDQIKPIGVKLHFHPSIIDGIGLEYPSRKYLTKGFIIVRQKRIPDILCQGISIGTTKKGHIPVIKASTSKGGTYFTESFIKNVGGVPVLGRDIYNLSDDQVLNNALLCPEANMRSSIFSSLFNSSLFKLRPYKYFPQVRGKFIKIDGEDKLFGLSNLEEKNSNDPIYDIDTELLFVQSDTSLVYNKNNYFTSVAGNAMEA